MPLSDLTVPLQANTTQGLARWVSEVSRSKEGEAAATVGPREGPYIREGIALSQLSHEPCLPVSEQHPLPPAGSQREEDAAGGTIRRGLSLSHVYTAGQ